MVINVSDEQESSKRWAVLGSRLSACVFYLSVTSDTYSLLSYTCSLDSGK